MITVLKYHCPTCTQGYDTMQEAERCKQSHKIYTRNWIVCEICGNKWCSEFFAYGPKLAKQEAEKCEKSHTDIQEGTNNEKA